VKRKLLTPAPLYHGQIGAHLDGTLWEADYHNGRLCWRNIPAWNILRHISIRCKQYLGADITKLETLRGRR